MVFDFLINFLFNATKRYKKKLIIKKISYFNSSRIIYGAYKSVFINSIGKFSGDLPSKLLGIYEEQVQNKIIELCKKKSLKFLINFGAGDGYHVIGLIKNKIFEKAIAFEIDNEIQKRLIYNIKKNNVSSKILVLGKASFRDINKFINYEDLKKSLFLVDIEGEEFSLFSKKNLNYFKNSYLIIENHQTLINNKKNLIKKFFLLMKNNFKLIKICHSNKNPFIIESIKNLNEDDKWLAMSECRNTNQDWIFCIPKKNSQIK
jgi:hypothetical protein